jgi:RNA polymerase sigma factor for flagellar operon FliA
MSKAQMTRERERELVGLYLASIATGEPDVEARNSLIEGHLGLIRWAAAPIQAAHKRHIELDELVNVGSMGMIDGLNRFDLSRNTRVSTYCLWWIRRAMHLHVRFVRYRNYLVEDHYRDLMKIYKTLTMMPVNFNGAIDFKELGRLTNFDVPYCRLLLLEAQGLVSLERPVSDDGKLTLEDSLEDRSIPNPVEVAAKETAKRLVRDGLDEISPQACAALKDHFFGGHGDLDPDEGEVAFTAGENEDVSDAAADYGSKHSVTISKKQHDAQRYLRKKGLEQLRALPVMEKAREVMNADFSRYGNGR